MKKPKNVNRSMIAVLLLCAAMMAGACRDDVAPVEAPLPRMNTDTTSHDFVWTFDTIGIQYSFINGVAAVSPDDIWVTGKFWLLDSLGQHTSKPVGNVAHWNGREWTYHGFNSAGRESWYEMHDAFARNADNVWVSGGGPFHWDGAKWTTYRYTNNDVFGGGIKAIWATEDAEYACVVARGNSCAYYRKDDGKFVKLQLPHNVDCLDVKGKEDGTMYVAASEGYSGYIYEVTPDRKVREYFRVWAEEPRAVWLHDNEVHFACRKSIYRIAELDGELVKVRVIETDHSIFKQVHEAGNNMFIMLQRQYFLHWNGSTWKEIEIPAGEILRTYDIDVTGNTVYFVGYVGAQYCVLARGRQL